MKHLYLILLSWLFINHACGQETVSKSNSISTTNIKEKFHVLKSNKNIRHGEYLAKTNKTIIAQGNYENGQRVGHWRFLNQKGEAIQLYDYTKHKLIFTDTADVKHLTYAFEQPLKENDTVRYPIKIGGVYYGLMPLVLEQNQVVKQLFSENMDTKTLELMHIFSISADGELIKHEILVTGNNLDKSFTVTDKDFDDEFKKFIPAQLNHHPVQSKVYIQSTVNFFANVSIRRL